MSLTKLEREVVEESIKNIDRIIGELEIERDVCADKGFTYSVLTISERIDNLLEVKKKLKLKLQK
jgi:hypothetical protein